MDIQRKALLETYERLWTGSSLMSKTENKQTCNFIMHYVNNYPEKNDSLTYSKNRTNS